MAVLLSASHYKHCTYEDSFTVWMKINQQQGQELLYAAQWSQYWTESY